jgi:hypothetical protein
LYERWIPTIVVGKKVAWQGARGVFVTTYGSRGVSFRRAPVVGQGKVHIDVVLFCESNKLVQALKTIRTGVDLRGFVLDKLQPKSRFRNLGDIYD